MTALIVKEDGKIYVNEVPEEPKHEHYGLTQDDTEDFWDDAEEHKKALASAKEAAVLCADQEQAHGVIWRNYASQKDRQHGNELKPGIYPIPDLKWEVVDVKIARILSTGDKHKTMPLRGQVAILTLSEQPKGEESQEEIWKEIYMDFRYGEGWIKFTVRMKSKFTITRNLKENQ